MSELADLYPGFASRFVSTTVGKIFARQGGSGPPLLLLHGYPQTNVMYHRVAPELAKRFTLVIPDLVGYGWSVVPSSDADHVPYTKRAMAAVMIEVMEALGFVRFGLVGHDRGGRVAYRLALDHPERVEKLAVLDIMPTYDYWQRMDRTYGLKMYHWLFLAQPEPFPETMINAVPGEWFLRGRGSSRNVPKIVWDEYIRCYTKKTIAGACRDYRANAGIDFEMDTADKDRQIGMPLLILWGTRGAPPTQEFPTVWRKFASNLVDAQPLPTGHYLQEEAPDQVVDHFIKFFTT